MDKIEEIEDLYRRKFSSIPESIYKEIGHFNVFRLEPYIGNKANPIPYKRQDFYKITLVNGNSKIHYADKIIEVKNHSLVFSNPLIHYKYEHTDNICSGSFCTFSHVFFHQYKDVNEYTVFQQDGNHMFELDDEQVKNVNDLFESMFQEINSGYIYKYDVLRLLVFELIHFAIKMKS
jgi:AraC family transcriptional regulator, transcriptional activator of pobA